MRPSAHNFVVQSQASLCCASKAATAVPSICQAMKMHSRFAVTCPVPGEICAFHNVQFLVAPMLRHAATAAVAVPHFERAASKILPEQVGDSRYISDWTTNYGSLTSEANHPTSFCMFCFSPPERYLTSSAEAMTGFSVRCLFLAREFLGPDRHPWDRLHR